MEALLTFSAVGLAYDGVGVTILGLASLLERPRDTLKQSQNYWEGNDPLLQRLVTSKYDITAGSIMLLIGFLLQLVASLKVETNTTLLMILLLGLCILPPWYLFRWRTKLIAKYMREVKDLDALRK
jgi:hypothetical protein